MSGGTSETKQINFAMANKVRRKIINSLANGDRNIEEIEGRNVKLSENGKNFLKGKKETSTEVTKDLSQAKPVEIAEIRQLLPCIADSSKFRVIANMSPP